MKAYRNCMGSFVKKTGRCFNQSAKWYKDVSTRYKVIHSLVGWSLFIWAFCTVVLFVAFTIFVVFPTLTNHLSLYNPIRIILNAYMLYLCFLVLFTLLRLKFSDPGSPTEEWYESVRGNPDYTPKFSKTVKGECFSRYCQKCDKPKPPRTHHCEVCEKCVTRMDHHCVWVNNCVGYKNYRFFLLFLIWVVIGLNSVSFFMSFMYFKIAWFADYDMFEEWLSYYHTTFVLIFIYDIAVSIFFFLHLYFSATNQTTIEFVFNKDKARKLGFLNPNKVNEFDIGKSGNLNQIFWDRSLPRVLLCPCLPRTPIGDGCSYPTKERKDIQKDK